jgi:hypothetical protein
LGSLQGSQDGEVQADNIRQQLMAEEEQAVAQAAARKAKKSRQKVKKQQQQQAQQAATQQLAQFALSSQQAPATSSSEGTAGPLFQDSLQGDPALSASDVQAASQAEASASDYISAGSTWRGMVNRQQHMCQAAGLLSKGSCSQPCILSNTICCCCVVNGCQQDRPQIHGACHSCTAFAELPNFQGEMDNFATVPACQMANAAHTVQALLILSVVCLA